MTGVADLVVSYINELRHVYLFLEARDTVEAFEMVITTNYDYWLKNGIKHASLGIRTGCFRWRVPSVQVTCVLTFWLVDGIRLFAI